MLLNSGFRQFGKVSETVNWATPSEECRRYSNAKRHNSPFEGLLSNSPNSVPSVKVTGVSCYFCAETPNIRLSALKGAGIPCD